MPAPNRIPLTQLFKSFTGTPVEFLKLGIQANPKLKPLLGVLAIVSAIALALTLVSSARVAVIGTLIVLVLMVLVVIFSALTLASGALRIAAIFMMFAFLTLTIATIFLIVSSMFFKWPLDLHTWVTGPPPIATPTATPTPIVTPTPLPLNASINLNEGRTLKSALKDIAQIDDARVIFSNCSQTLLLSKIRGGLVRAENTAKLLEQLQYRIQNPKTSERYNVTRKEQEHTYEIQCAP